MKCFLRARKLLRSAGGERRRMRFIFVPLRVVRRADARGRRAPPAQLACRVKQPAAELHKSALPRLPSAFGFP